MNCKPARLLLLLAAIAAAPVMAQNTTPSTSQNAAVVNGVAIPASRVDDIVKQYTSQQNGPKDSPELREKIKDDLIAHELLYQAAQKAHMEKTPEVKDQMEIARQQIMTRAYYMDYLKKNPVSDADVSAEYDKFKQQYGDKEYHIHLIVVRAEDEAKAIIAKLKAGASFEELAKQSVDPSANNGGDLDWVIPGRLPKVFADAMVALQKGQMTETPVQTPYGFNIIRLDDIRAASIPGLAELKPQIEESLKQKELATYVSELRKKAVIK